MTSEQKDILKQAADLFIQTVSQEINATKEHKEQLRQFMKEAIAASESLDKLELEE